MILLMCIDIIKYYYSIVIVNPVLLWRDDSIVIPIAYWSIDVLKKYQYWYYSMTVMANDQ